MSEEYPCSCNLQSMMDSKLFPIAQTGILFSILNPVPNEVLVRVSFIILVDVDSEFSENTRDR